ncbi:MAG: cyclic nucleotide-binding protein [Deltaproteobacteria bacterium]|nr:cyclic nucleotide-binding protein [Deltaproteobacteria bacterium]
MFRLLWKWLNVYEDEAALFLWAAFLLFIIHVGNILFTNTAETAFLKRYGVQYLPVMYMINAAVTFFVMGMLTGAMARMPDSRLLSYMLVGSGGLVGALRFTIPLGHDIIYPVLFLLKSQLEVLLAVVFWNMANDLLTTRQSKRLFPLLTAGGVIGAILGSFATSPLARLVRMDNLLLAYLAISLIGAAVARLMGHLYPTLLVQDPAAVKNGKAASRSNMIQEFKKILPLVKESTLVRVLIALSLMANIVITIINYQFNFAVNASFATEVGMIHFFAVFRGFLNIISLVLLLFVGRLYGRWGLPVALMIHPFNYVIAFLALLFRFDIYSAMYARISTNVLRTTINAPAMAVLMGLFHSSQRAVVRPFLRGTVVRIGTLVGSGLILLLGGVFHPRYLSIIALFCMGIWLAYDVILKQQYPNILLNLISRKLLDLKSLEQKEIVQVFKDKRMQARLRDLFLSSRGKDALWYGALLRNQDIPDVDNVLLTVLKREDDQIRIGLLDLLSDRAGSAAIPIFRELADPGRPYLMVAMAKAARRFPPQVSRDFYNELFNTVQEPEARGYALAGLYDEAPNRYQEIIRSFLYSNMPEERWAGVIAAGESGNEAFADTLRERLGAEADQRTLCALFRALRQLKNARLNSIVSPYLSHSSETIRMGALEAFEIQGDEDLRRVIGLMGDPVPEIGARAMEMIQASAYQNPAVLVKSLNIPSRKVREGLFRVLETLDIKALDVYRFARTQLKKAYSCLLEKEALKALLESPERDLLMDHLIQEGKTRIENVLRVLSIQDTSGRIRVIWRGLSSSDARQRSNGIEALTHVADRALTTILIPVVEDLRLAEKLKAGRKTFAFPEFREKPSLMAHLMAKGDWVTSQLALSLAAKRV